MISRKGETSYRRARSVGGEIGLLFRAIVAVTVALLAVNVATRVWLLARVAPQVTALHETATHLNDLHAALVDEETGLRGYLATGAPVFLQPYDESVPRAEAASAALRSDVARARLDHDLATDLAAIEDAHRKWQNQWAAVAAGSEALRMDLAASADQQVNLRVFLLRGKQLFDGYRVAHDRFVRHIDEDLAAADRLQTEWLLGGGALQVSVALVVVAASLRARRRLTRQVTQPLDALAGTVSEIRQGRLTARVPELRAPRDLQELGHDIDEMAIALEEQMALAEERARQARRHGDRLSVVLTAARQMAASLALPTVVESISGAALDLGALEARVWLLHEDEPRLELFGAPESTGALRRSVRMAIGEGLVGAAAQSARRVGPILAGSGELTVAVPLNAAGQVVGVLEAVFTSDGALGGDTIEVLEALAAHAAGAVTSARLHAQVNAYALTDALSGLANRRSFDADLLAEVSRAERHGRALSVISLDLDHFKNLNDRHGHAAGDRALQRVGAILLRALRPSDRAFRVGGEELAVLAPETTAAQAARLAERLRRAIESARPLGEPGVTASFGIAEWEHDDESGHRMLEAADRALYRSKSLGRNCVTVAPVDVLPRRRAAALEPEAAASVPSAASA